jgi:hypothetical protein
LFKLASVLSTAWRHQEAHAVTKKLTQERPNDPEAWVYRGDSDYMAGDTKDTLDSYRQALALDLDANVPPQVRNMLKKEK